MLTFLFWNVAKKPIQQLIAAAAWSVNADVIVLCECQISPSELLENLNVNTSDYHYAPGQCEQLMFFTKFETRFLVPIFESARISIRRLSLPARQDILITGVHLPSKMHFSEQSLVQECFVLNRFIENEEEIVGHKRTVVLGDLNVNPFEAGVVGAGGLHAVSTRTVALKGSRIVQSRQYHFFYNPMWRYFGDREDGPPGTYYYEKAEGVNYFWNIYDQILLRPDLLEGFDQDKLRILTTVGANALLDSAGKPDNVNLSDHLPIVFELKF